jgi:hypothetical protein
VTNTTPTVTNATPVVTNTTPTITNSTPVVTNTTPTVTNATPVVTNTTFAQFVGTDTITKGSWNGVYGKDGYSLSAYTAKLPAYAQMTATGKGDWVWQWSTTDTRALQKPGFSDREAGTWYGDSFTMELNLTDGNSHRVSFYCLDWDQVSNRAQTIEISDASTGAVLSTQTVNNFGNGTYLTWNLKGRVKIKVTKTGGYNAAVSGVFFGS